MQLPENWRDNIQNSIEQTAIEIQNVLKRKFEQVRKALEGLTLFGPETDEEANDKEKLLYDFWAISRALEVRP